MDIKEIVDSKGSRAAAVAAAAAVNGTGQAQDLQLFQSMSRSNSLPMSETASDRGNSPHGSEQSRYSASRIGQLGGMTGAPSNAYFPPGQVSMLQQPFRQDQNSNAIALQQDDGGLHQTPGDGSSTKAFPCSTCGKGFARRSDLARHGKCKLIQSSHSLLNSSCRTDT